MAVLEIPQGYVRVEAAYNRAVMNAERVLGVLSLKHLARKRVLAAENMIDSLVDLNVGVETWYNQVVDGIGLSRIRGLTARDGYILTRG